MEDVCQEQHQSHRVEVQVRSSIKPGVSPTPDPAPALFSLSSVMNVAALSVICEDFSGDVA